MTTIDNFDLIRENLKFESEDDFYFVQILTRSKDGHRVTGSNKNRLVKFYTIRSLQEFKDREEEIKSICRQFNARAYIHPTKRSLKAVAKVFLKFSMDEYLEGHFDELKRAYSTACGKSVVKKYKQYVVDIDFNPAFTDYANIESVHQIRNFINKECEPKDTFKVLYEVPTVHGLHLVTTPFNTEKFKQEFPEIDVHKNNPTLLYYEVQEQTSEIPSESKTLGDIKG